MLLGKAKYFASVINEFIETGFEYVEIVKSVEAAGRDDKKVKVVKRVLIQLLWNYYLRIVSVSLKDLKDPGEKAI